MKPLMIDGQYTFALLQAARQEGFVERDRFSSRLRKRFRGYSKTLYRCLEMILLYDQVVINNTEALELQFAGDQLFEHTEIDFIKVWTWHQDRDWNDPPDYLGFRAKSEYVISSVFARRAIPFSSYLANHNKKNYLWLKLSQPDIVRYIGLLAKVPKWFERIPPDVEASVKRDPLFLSKRSSQISDGGTQCSIRDFLRGVYFEIHDAQSSFDRVLSFSSRYEAPVLSGVRLRAPSTGFFSQEADQQWRTYKIVLSSLSDYGLVLPKVESLADVIRLRGHKYFRDFREALHAWVSCIRAGDLASEDRIRRDVFKSNKELEKLGPWGKVEDWTNILSLPVGIAETLIGGIPILSTAMALVGIAAMGRRYLTRRRNRWLLFIREQ